jgi:hypothetical protein
MGVFRIVWVALRAMFGDRVRLGIENLALRKQLLVLQRSVKRPQLRKPERIFWV